MLQSLGRSVYRGRWIVLSAWLLLVAIAAVFAPRVSGVLKGGGYSIGNSQSVAAYNQLRSAYGYRALIFTAVFSGSSRNSEQLLLDAARRFRRQSSQRLGHSLSFAPPVLSSDKAIVLERIYSDPQDDFGAHYAAPLARLLPHEKIVGRLTGSSAIYRDMERVSDQDLQRIELFTLPLAALFLLLIFGSVVAAATPVIMAPISVTLSLALIYFIAHRVDMSIFVLNTSSMLGLGIAIDYSLFMVNRFREELALGSDTEAAVGRTVATAGRSILVSACVVGVGFFALTLSGVQMLSSLGIGGSIVTAFSLLVALTLLPALLGVLGERINLLPLLPRRFRLTQVWRTIALRVMRSPWQVIGLVSVSIAILALPAFHLRVGIPGPEILPSSVESRAGNDLLDHHLGYANRSPVLVVVTRLPGTAPSTARGSAFLVVDRICSSSDVVGLASTPIVDAVSQIQSCGKTLQILQNASASQVAQGNARAASQRVALLSVFLRSEPSSAIAEKFVAGLRRSLHVPGYRILVGGQTGAQMDFNSFLYSRFPLVILFVVATIYIVLLIAFRSVLLPLKAVVMNIFSVLAAYGVVVFAFQDGYLSHLLGFTVVGNIDSIVPILLFCILFGISTDYEVFLLSRVQEEFLKTGNNEESVAIGLEVTGRIITSAAVVMIVVFGAFAFARLVVVKEVGLGLALAVLVDATLIRALLVPATMRLLGRWNWWLPIRGFPEINRPVVVPQVGKTPAAQ